MLCRYNRLCNWCCNICIGTIIESKTRWCFDGKVDYLVRGFDEQKKDQKQRNDHQDDIISEHAIAIENLQTRMKNVEKVVFNKHE